MTIKQYDKIQLITDKTAYIVEILEPQKAFIADISRDGDIETDFITMDDIKSVID